MKLWNVISGITNFATCLTMLTVIDVEPFSLKFFVIIGGIIAIAVVNYFDGWYETNKG